MQYPVKLEPDTNGTIMVTFPDVPEAVTFGDDEAEALARAVDALETAFMGGKVRKTELARRLGIHMPQVDRLLDLRHASRLDQMKAALGSVGKRLPVAVEDAP